MFGKDGQSLEAESKVLTAVGRAQLTFVLLHSRTIVTLSPRDSFPFLRG